MATLNLGRVRLNFKGNFVDLDTQTLEFFDAVTFAGSLYVVKVPSVTVDNSDNGNRPPTTNGLNSFIKITDGVTFIGTWQYNNSNESTRIYYQNEIVRYGANSYIALQEVPTGRQNPNTEVINNTGYWSELVKGFGNYVPNFNATQQLSIGDIFRWKGSVYLTLDEIIQVGDSPDTLPDSFDRLDNGLAPRGQWQPNTLYNFLDTVNFHGRTYAVIEPYGSNNPPLQANGNLDSEWELLTEGFQFQGELNPNLTDGYYPNDVITFNGGTYLVIEKTFQYQTPVNAADKFTVLIPNDSIRASNFTTDGFIVRENGTLVVDTNTYLTDNQTITVSGDASGSGQTAIDLTLTADSIVSKPSASAEQTRLSNTRVLGIVYINGAPELRQINPNDVTTDEISIFDNTLGIERLPGEIGNTATLRLNTNALTSLVEVAPVDSSAGLPDLVSADQFLIRDDSDDSLKSLSYQQLLQTINAQITGPVSPGVDNFLSLLDTPTFYSGKGSFVKINNANNALEFVEDDIFLQILVYG